MSLRIRQIVFAARDLKTTVAQFEAAFGLKVCYRDPQVGEFGLENALFPIGDQFLEIVAPVREDTAAGRHLERHGDSAYMLILQTDDLDRDRQRFKKLGVRSVWQSDYPDIRATHLHPKDIGGAIVSVDQPVPPESWRWAGPNWKQFVTTTVRSVDAATIGATNPSQLADRWSEVLGTMKPTDSGGRRRIAIESGLLDFERNDRDLIVAYDLTVSDRAKNGAQVELCGTRFRLHAAN